MKKKSLNIKGNYCCLDWSEKHSRSNASLNTSDHEVNIKSNKQISRNVQYHTFYGNQNFAKLNNPKKIGFQNFDFGKY